MKYCSRECKKVSQIKQMLGKIGFASSLPAGDVGSGLTQPLEREGKMPELATLVNPKDQHFALVRLYMALKKMNLKSFVLCFSICTAQQKILYKQIDTTKLFMQVYAPKFLDSSKSYPAMVFFFGGGWSSGDKTQFINHAMYFSQRGIICFLVDYRTKNKNHTTPFESLKDAKTAIRFIRKNATDYRVDTSKIIASGGSSGGQLAAATALIDACAESNDDLSISCIPNALVLFNPVIDNGPGGYGYEKIGEAYRFFSPLHNIKKGSPPTIIFLGTNDKHIPIETAEYYKKVMEKVGSKCELRLYEGQGHGFFNHKNLEYFKKTINETDKFLISLGYLKEEPIVTIE